MAWGHLGFLGKAESKSKSLALPLSHPPPQGLAQGRLCGCFMEVNNSWSRGHTGWWPGAWALGSDGSVSTTC